MNRPEYLCAASPGAEHRVALPRLAELAFALLSTDCIAAQGAEATWLGALGRLADDCAASLAPRHRAARQRCRH
jgi:hypothetical protein